MCYNILKASNIRWKTNTWKYFTNDFLVMINDNFHLWIIQYVFHNSGWWFQTCLIFHHIWDNPSDYNIYIYIWLLFWKIFIISIQLGMSSSQLTHRFQRVETTNQLKMTNFEWKLIFQALTGSMLIYRSVFHNTYMVIYRVNIEGLNFG